MLVLSRKVGEQIIIADNIAVRILGVQGGRVRIGIEAPLDVSIRRQELAEFPETKDAEPVGHQPSRAAGRVPLAAQLHAQALAK